MTAARASAAAGVASPPFRGSASRCSGASAWPSSARTGPASRRWCGCCRRCLINDGGSAHVFGIDVFDKPRSVQRLVNRVSVEASFFKRMSPMENLSYSARFYGMGPRETRARIPEILALVGFPPERGHEPMEDLSRGMQQKIALARALLTAPVLLLLDEPTTGLDPRSKLEVQDFIRQMREHHDSTILLCTHDMAEAEALADRIGILHRGELLCLETAERDPAALPRRHARAGIPERDRPLVRGRGRGEPKGGTGMIRPEQGGALRRELIGFAGIVERNMYLIKRFAWWELAWFLYTVANTLTIVFIAQGHRGRRWPPGREPHDHRAPDRRRDLVVPGPDLRDRDRDRGLGAMGGNHRVHVHGADLTRVAPAGDGRLRRHLRRAANRAAVRGRGGVPERQLRQRRLRQRRRWCC